MKLSNLNLNSLLHFNSIAKNKSLRLAAKELHLSPPAVTHSLNNLEQSLKTKLCIRNRSGFELTDVGVKLFQATQKIFAEIEGFSAEQTQENHFSGILSIGILDHFENQKIEESLKIASQKFPEMKLSIQSYDSDTINRLILDRQLHIGFGTFSNRSPLLKYIKIGDEALKYYISKNHPLWKKRNLHKEDLTGQKTTWLDNRNRTKSDLEENIFVENIKYKMQFYGFSNNLSGALQILFSGHAVVPLPESYGDTLAKSYPIKKINLESNSKVLDQVLVYNPSERQNKVAKFIIQFVESLE